MKFDGPTRFGWYGHIVTALALITGLSFFKLSILYLSWLFMSDWHAGFGFTNINCFKNHGDFTMFWLAGFILQHGPAVDIYNYSHFIKATESIAQLAPPPFIYPPTILPTLAFFSLLPLAASYYLFSAASLGVSAILLYRAGIPRWCILAGLVSPAAMWNLYLGQFGLLCGALLVFGLSRLQTQPRRAGLILSLLAIKPQFALLVPMAVLARRNWATLLAGATGTVGILALALAYAGTAAWGAYLGAGRDSMRALLNAAFIHGSQHTPAYDYQYYGTSVFWMLRSLHAGLPLSYAGQGAISLACMLTAWHLWQSGAENRLAATIFLTPLASPYGFTDDLAVYSVLLPTLARRNTPWRNATLAWLWAAPTFTPGITAQFGFLPTPLLLLAALCLAQQKQPLLTEEIRQRA